jgi:hypothetical protein
VSAGAHTAMSAALSPSSGRARLAFVSQVLVGYPVEVQVSSPTSLAFLGFRQ